MGATIASTGRICANWMLTGAIGCYDPATRKAATYLIPTPSAVPYGQTIDPSDNVWVAEWNGGKLGRYNFKNQSWTEFAPPTYPANFRRGPESDAEGNIWTGIWSTGKIAGKIAKLDPKTGTWTTWDIPHSGAQPYEASIDKDGNVWFPDTAQPNSPINIGGFNPRDQSFTFYPRPQFVADSTRVSHAADGSVHYTARYGSAKDSSAFGVLFPDKDKITTLAPLRRRKAVDSSSDSSRDDWEDWRGWFTSAR
jgi:streptogramin lyase